MAIGLLIAMLTWAPIWSDNQPQAWPLDLPISGK